MIKTGIQRITDSVMGYRLRCLRYDVLRIVHQFASPEPEFDMLNKWVSPGDIVIDVGANVGHYSLRLASLVGPTGLVYAFEPVQRTFAFLSYNVAASGMTNLILFNAAASDEPRQIRMTVPETSGRANYYGATVAANGHIAHALVIDSLALPPVAFAKIDVEGHEASVLQGMRALIERDRPVVLAEGRSPEVGRFFEQRGYVQKMFIDSPNAVYLPPES